MTRKHNPLIYIVIPVFNRIEYTRECLKSLEAQTLQGIRIVVVDDGSTDGTPEVLAEEFPGVVVLHGTGNLFWTASINLGIRHALEAGADYVLTLNNDTIATPDFMERMMYWADRTPNALLGALDIDHQTGRPYYGGEIFNWLLAKSTYLLNSLPESQRHGLHEVSLYPGRGLLIPRNVFEKIGLFDERRLPHYLADYDFTQVARRNGFKIYCNYDARLFTYPEEGGDHKIRKAKTLPNFFRHLFDIKGGGNLRNYTVYTLKNCPSLLVPAALTAGYVRRLAGFWMNK
jgi:GT2 family glycosyltransferase